MAQNTNKPLNPALRKTVVMRSLKFLKPETKYLLKSIDDDIAQKNKFLEHRLKWMRETKPTDPYFQRDVNATYKKISFLETLREKILNFA